MVALEKKYFYKTTTKKKELKHFSNITFIEIRVLVIAMNSNTRKRQFASQNGSASAPKKPNTTTTFEPRRHPNLQKTRDLRNTAEEKNENDQDRFEQDIDTSHMSRRQKGIGQVRLDYDSDSSDDGQTRRERDLISKRQKERRHQKMSNKSMDDDDDDMFSGSDEDKEEVDEENDELQQAKEALERKGKVELLDMENFERELEQAEEEPQLKDRTGLQPSEANMATEQEPKSSLFSRMTGKELHEDKEDEAEEEVTATNVDIDYFVHPELDYDDDRMDIDDSHPRKPKPKQEPKLEGFNLRDDMEEGKFDVDGNFIRNAADENAHQDLWLSGVSKMDIIKARNAHLRRQQEDEAKEIASLGRTNGDAKGNKTLLPTSDFLSRLIDILDVCETPLEALQKLQKESLAEKKKRQQELKNKRLAKRKKQNAVSESNGQENGGIDEENDQAAKALQRHNTIETITECADTLMRRGLQNVYDLMREELQKQYQKETGTPYSLKRKRENEDSKEEDALRVSQKTQSSTKEWEFKWQGDDQVHGPYDSETMRNWIRDSYFEETPAKVRLSGSDNPFVSYDFVTFD